MEAVPENAFFDWRRYLESAVETIAEGILIVHRNGRIVYANSSAARILGFKRDQAIGRAFDDPICRISKTSGKACPNEEHPHIRTLKTGIPIYGVDFLFIRPDGSRTVLSLNAAPLRDETGEVVATVETIVDVTERERAVLGLRESEERFCSLVDAATDAIVGCVDSGRRVSLWGKAAETMFGFTAEEIVGKPLNWIIPPKLRDKHRFGVERLIATGEASYLSKIIEFVGLRKDGSEFPIEISLGAWTHGNEVSFVSIIRDISDRQVRERLSGVLNRINTVMNSTLDLDEIIQRVMVEAANAIGSETGAIILREGDRWITKYSYRYKEDIIGVVLTDDDAPHAALAARTQEPVAIDDAYNDPRVNRAIMERYSIRSVLTVPLIVKGTTIGVMFLNHHAAPVSIDDAQIDFARKLAFSVSLALENARLFKGEVEARLQEQARARRMEALHQISDVVVSSLNKREVATSSVEWLGGRLGLRSASIWLADKAREVLVPTASVGYPPGLFEALPPVNLSEPCDLTKVFKSGRPAIVRDATVSFVPEHINVGMEFGAYIILALKGREEMIGALVLAWEQPKDFTHESIEFFATVANSLAVGLENARLYEAEREVAGTLQKALMIMPEQVTGVDFGHVYRSATAEAAEVGGDFYDLFELEYGKIGVVIGDVSGKGLDAATLTALVKNTIRAYAYEREAPSDVMVRVNKAVQRAAPFSTFVTVFFGVLDTKTGRFVHCNGGHLPPLIRRKSGEIAPVVARCPIVGALPELEYTDDRDVMKPGDTLVLYTDGVTEARREGEFFGEERLVRLVRDVGAIPAHEASRRILDEVLHFTGGKLSDDLAILVVSLKGEKEAA